MTSIQDLLKGKKAPHPSPPGKLDLQPDNKKQIGKNDNSAADRYCNPPVLSRDYLHAADHKKQVAQRKTDFFEEQGVGKEKDKAQDDSYQPPGKFNDGRN